MEKLHTDQSVDGLVTGFAYGAEVECEQFFRKGYPLDIRLEITDAISVSPGMNALHRHPPSEFDPEASGGAEIQHTGSCPGIQQEIQRFVVPRHGDFQPEIPVPILKWDLLRSVSISTERTQQADSQKEPVEKTTMHERKQAAFAPNLISACPENASGKRTTCFFRRAYPIPGCFSNFLGGGRRSAGFVGGFIWTAARSEVFRVPCRDWKPPAILEPICQIDP